jgi:hypothetical protein
LLANKTSPGGILETSDLLDSTDMDFNLAMHDEPESYPYKTIMLGMGLIVLCFIVFLFIQMRSKRKRSTQCKESSTYHEIPETHGVAPLEIRRHYNEITEGTNDALHENVSQPIYLTVDSAENDVEDAGSDVENRDLYVKPISKEETHLYVDVLESSYDVTSEAGHVVSCSGVLNDSMSTSEPVQQNDTYLDVITVELV